MKLQVKSWIPSVFLVTEFITATTIVCASQAQWNAGRQSVDHSAVESRTQSVSVKGKDRKGSSTSGIKPPAVNSTNARSLPIAVVGGDAPLNYMKRRVQRSPVVPIEEPDRPLTFYAPPMRNGETIILEIVQDDDGKKLTITATKGMRRFQPPPSPPHLAVYDLQEPPPVPLSLPRVENPGGLLKVLMESPTPPPAVAIHRVSHWRWLHRSRAKTELTSARKGTFK